MLRRLVMIWLIALPWLAGAAAAGTTTPSGATVLTVVGKISQTNRPPFDKLTDPFFAYHERAFAKAYAFDLAMLEGLGMTRAVVAYEGWPDPLEIEGPLLRDVLAAAGASEGTVAILALDGFAAELTPDELAGENWILAIKANGRYLGIGQRGPAWVLYARSDGKIATAEDEHRWPWAVFLIEVQ